MSEPRILIAGIGNIFLGDDAFGVEVVRRLAERPLPDGVRVVDFGIRALDLAFALQDEYEAVVLVDATPRGGAPGTLYLIEPEAPDLQEPAPGDLLVQTHGMDPVKVLRLAGAMGSGVRRVFLVGCEPFPVRDDGDTAQAMSDPVHAAVDEALRLVEGLTAQLLAGQDLATPASGVP